MSLTTVLIRLLCERLEFATYFEILFDSTHLLPHLYNYVGWRESVVIVNKSMFCLQLPWGKKFVSKYGCLFVSSRRCVDPRLAQKLPDRLLLNFHQICILGQSRFTKCYYSTCMKNFKNQRFGQKSKCFPKCLVFTGRWDSPGGI